MVWFRARGLVMVSYPGTSYPRDRREAVFAALGGCVLGYGSSIYHENWKL